MITRKTSEQLERMRASGGIAARVRDELCARVAPGITTGELDAIGAELIRGHDAKSAFLGYRDYPGHVCISVNSEVVHGLPGARRIELGDVVSVDVGVVYNGFIGDTASTVMVGVSDMDTVRLVTTTEEALREGIAMAVSGNRLSDISHAIEQVATQAGFGVVKDFVGHGIGSKMHEEPQIPNFGPPGKGPRLEPGMTLALEPMVNMGTDAVDIMDDGWTVLTRDRKPSAHFEHTIAVRENMPAEILTL